MVVKIVNDELIGAGFENNEINLSSKPPAIIMMVGFKVQGKLLRRENIHGLKKIKKKL